MAGQLRQCESIVIERGSVFCGGLRQSVGLAEGGELWLAEAKLPCAVFYLGIIVFSGIVGAVIGASYIITNITMNYRKAG